MAYFFDHPAYIKSQIISYLAGSKLPPHRFEGGNPHSDKEGGIKYRFDLLCPPSSHAINSEDGLCFVPKRFLGETSPSTEKWNPFAASVGGSIFVRGFP